MITRTDDGDFLLELPDLARSLLRRLPGQLRELLTTDDPALERLFPPAYTDDPERNAEYRSLMQSDLVARRLTSIDVVEETVDARRLDEGQLLAWLGALNDLRLVLGSRLGITDDEYEFDEAGAGGDERDERAS
ncbi:MAG: DUF2017 family protein, partial [Acidimicrobiales bacterium]